MSVADRIYQQQLYAEGRNIDPILFAIAGPVSIFCTLALALQARCNLDLMALALFGLYLCVKRQKKGALYSFLLLIAGALCKHAWFLEKHLWQCGIECSMALGFVITALSCELFVAKKEVVEQVAAQRLDAIRHLDENLVKLKEESQQEKIAYQKKIGALQKELDDQGGELSSLKALSEMLRSGIVLREEHALKDAKIEFEKREAELLFHIEELEQKLACIQEENGLIVENKQLLQELNSARTSREQTHLINEALARLVASYSKRHQEQPLSRTQVLYRQLRHQFEEKTQTLHQTRVQLFHAETALEGIHLEQIHQAAGPSPMEQSLEQQLVFLADECEAFERENEELTELISYLSQARATAFTL